MTEGEDKLSYRARWAAVLQVSGLAELESMPEARGMADELYPAEDEDWATYLERVKNLEQIIIDTYSSYRDVTTSLGKHVMVTMLGITQAGLRPKPD